MNHSEKLNEIIAEIEKAINAISILKFKASCFQEELDFYNENENNLDNPEGLLMRLGDEVAFLCIDTYSLYQGLTKKKSLYSKVIRQHGKDLSHIDETPNYLGVVGLTYGSLSREMLRKMNKLITDN